MLKGSDLWFRYHPRLPWVIQHQNLNIALGEIVGLMAPSGYGKTTLGKLLSGYLLPTKGQITIAGAPLPRRGYCPVQLVFQNPELTVNPRWRIRQILQEAYPPDPVALEALGVHADWFNRYPHELSGGELQRIAIARVLNPVTRYLIADEMTAMLDANTQALIWQAVLTFAKQQQIGVLLISHHQRLLQRLCSQLIALTGHETALVNTDRSSLIRDLPHTAKRSIENAQLGIASSIQQRNRRGHPSRLNGVKKVGTADSSDE